MAGNWSPMVELENQFDHVAAISFAQNIWSLSFFLSTFYVVTIFSIQSYMRGRPKYDLRGPLMTWSLLLAVFSLLGFCINGVHHISYFFQHGWKRSVCDTILVTGQRGLWTFLFCFSKFPELVDTYFIVLRKQKLIFLHWYHHITVFIYCWYSYAFMNNSQQWFITMNYFVHTLMYFYYAIRASGLYRPPLWVNMLITSLQLLQMVIGVWVNIYLFINMRADPTWYCDGKAENYFHIYIAFAMYASYFVLFAQFFYSAYLSKKRKKPVKESAAVASAADDSRAAMTTVNGWVGANGSYGNYLNGNHKENKPIPRTSALSFTRNRLHHRINTTAQ